MTADSPGGNSSPPGVLSGLVPGLGDDDALKRESARAGGDALYAMSFQTTRGFKQIGPDADIIDGVWFGVGSGTPGDLFSFINETSPSDAGYIRQPDGGGSGACQLNIFNLKPFRPGAALKVRLGQNTPPAGIPDNDFQVLLGGGIVTRTVAQPPVGFTTYTFTFSAAERAALNAVGAPGLVLQFTGITHTNPGNTSLCVSWARLFA